MQQWGLPALLLALVIAFVLIVALVVLPGSTDAAFWGVILGAVIAGGVSIGGEWLRGVREDRLDSWKRRDDRRIESDKIQRSVLYRIQNDLDEWRASRPGSGDAMQRAMSRTERVLDDALRAHLVEFAEKVAGLPSGGLPAHVTQEFDVVRKEIGTVLRRYLEPPK